MILPLGEAAGLLAALCWAFGSLLFARLGRSGAGSAGAMNAAKCVVACLILFAAQMILRGTPLPGSPPLLDLMLLAASAVIGLTVGDTAYLGALTELGAPRAVLLLSSAPLFTVILEATYRRALPPGRELVGILLTLSGLVLVLARPLSTSAGSERGPGFRRGLGLGALAGLCQGLGSLLSRAATRRSIDPLTASWFRLAVGAAALFVVAGLTGQLPRWSRELRAPGVFVKIGSASLVGSVLGLWLAQVSLARSASGGVATTLLATSPIFALPLAHLMGAERASLRSVLGVLVAFGGIVLLLLP